ncbi:hypothetical protein CsSME_00039824 [Camellia sinensis var. sinensis]
MATRIAKVTGLASSLIGIVGRDCVSKIWWASSSSSILSSVIDVVNDCKLPPELCGQRIFFGSVKNTEEILIQRKFSQPH